MSSSERESLLRPSCAQEVLETLFAYAISEESGGSDVLGIDTTAIYDGGEWVLNGAKSWITNAGAANAYIVAARTAFSGRSRNMSLFCVDGAADGLSVTAEELIGMRGCPHGTVSFSNCRIPGRSLIGGEDQGYRLLKPTLLLGRLGVSAIAVALQSARWSLPRHTPRAPASTGAVFRRIRAFPSRLRTCMPRRQVQRARCTARRSNTCSVRRRRL